MNGEVGILFNQNIHLKTRSSLEHSEWRKLAKKARRKRIRQNRARLRDELEDQVRRRRENSPGYKIFLEEQARVEKFQAEEEARIAAERDVHWRKVEKEAQKQWQELQKKLAIAREERALQNEKIKLEWEKEQQQLKELKEQKERELQEQLKQQEILIEKVNDFLANGGDTPEHLKTKLETNPNKQLCPFFHKTSACRFYDVCSRNHVRPGISRIILISNFFSDYSLETTENEHGSDSSLEYEKHETYDHYREFFYDVIPELETFGKIKLFRTCCNHEPHLRGNVYVEYSSTRAALKCCRALNGRWYGGKQLNVEFCNIRSWRKALCGQYFVNRCPKGNSCNFLHVFQNPKNLYSYGDQHCRTSKHNTRNSHDDRDDQSDRRNWRWSESPERIPSVDWEDSGTKQTERRQRSRSKSRERSKSHRSHSKRHKRDYSRSRSKTPERDSRRSSGSSRRSRRSYKS